MQTILEQKAIRTTSYLTWLEINRDAVLHNLRKISERLVLGTKVLAVIKANAYGHGLLEMADCLRNEVEFFGVSRIEEAINLREDHSRTSILLFGVHPRESIELAIQHQVSLSISEYEQAREISNIASRLGIPAKVHVKMDSGMGRIGIQKENAIQELRHISMLDMIYLEGIFTHFAQSDHVDDEFTQKQIASFVGIIEESAANGIHFEHRHASNSGGIVNYPDAHLNLVRPGISLYGIPPSPSLKLGFELEPVLSWRARIVQLKKLSKGESTGYCRAYVAPRDTLIGILPVGYSHGYPFNLSNRGIVLCNGKRYPVVGRVSMDYIAVDFGQDAGSLKVGDVVTLLGKDGGELISADLLASGAKTISYEIVTQISPNLPRIIV